MSMQIPNYEKDIEPLIIQVRPKGTRSWLDVLPDEVLQRAFGKMLHEKFLKWMLGQTASIYGYYPSDVYSFLKHGLDKTPIYD